MAITPPQSYLSATYRAIVDYLETVTDFPWDGSSVAGEPYRGVVDFFNSQDNFQSLDNQRVYFAIERDADFSPAVEAEILDWLDYLPAILKDLQANGWLVEYNGSEQRFGQGIRPGGDTYRQLEKIVEPIDSQGSGLQVRYKLTFVYEVPIPQKYRAMF